MFFSLCYRQLIFKTMELDKAIKKMKLIEKTIKDLKKAGYNVFSMDNDKLVLESADRNIQNSNISNKEALRGCAGYGSVQHTFSDLEYDYEISL